MNALAPSCVLAAAVVAAPAPAAELVINASVPGTFVDIAATGTPLSLGDEGVVEIAPGFDLTATLFAGDGTGRMWVSSNGAVGFLGDGGAAGAFFLNAPLPSFALFGGAHGTPQALAVYWDNLAAGTGEVYSQVLGSPGERVLVVQWQDRPHFPGDPELDGDEATFQVQIFESASPGHAQLLFADVSFEDAALDGGASATIGYQEGAADAVPWSSDTPGAVSAGDVLTLRPAGDGDGDGTVGINDLLSLLRAWGPCASCTSCPCDFDDDCAAGITDLLALLAGWD